MKIAVLAETAADETRVAASPASVKAYVGKGLDVTIEQGAGEASFFSDDDYKAQGPTIAKTAASTVKDADIILSVRRPSSSAVKAMKKGAVVAAQLDPFGDRKDLDALAKADITAFSMELIPRITRAQSMDVLSSQANLAGYKAVIDAAEGFSRAFPMMMTAAGTVAPAKVFVMGAGVAGLQAIATARRLGAVVSATDVRAAAGEQVESLGAKFVFVEGMEDSATAGGYAKELSDEDKQKQAELVANHIKGQDIVITTALIPGRPAPELISKDMVETMQAGSIIVDMAVERGGNCPLSQPGKVVEHKGVTIMGYTNLPGRLPGNASQLYAKNLQNFITLMIGEGGDLDINWEDEIITGCALTHDGKAIHSVLEKK